MNRLQKGLKDDYLSKLIGIPINRPDLAAQTAFFRGAIYAIFELASKKDLIVKNEEETPTEGNQ